jgi:hypothetical protein
VESDLGADLLAAKWDLRNENAEIGGDGLADDDSLVP